MLCVILSDCLYSFKEDDSRPLVNSCRIFCMLIKGMWIKMGLFYIVVAVYPSLIGFVILWRTM